MQTPGTIIAVKDGKSLAIQLLSTSSLRNLTVGDCVPDDLLQAAESMSRDLVETN